MKSRDHRIKGKFNLVNGNHFSLCQVNIVPSSMLIGLDEVDFSSGPTKKYCLRSLSGTLKMIFLLEIVRKLEPGVGDSFL